MTVSIEDVRALISRELDAIDHECGGFNLWHIHTLTYDGPSDTWDVCIRKPLSAPGGYLEIISKIDGMWFGISGSLQTVTDWGIAIRERVRQ